MDGIRERKAALRQEVLARRDAMGEAERARASLAIADRIDAELVFAPGTIISGFLPIRSELDPRPLMTRLSARGARLCVPAITGGELQFREFLPDVPLEPQGFGTFAPGSGAAVLDPEIMLVPMSAFDARCHRIGYGRGYYDRAIETLNGKGRAPLLAGLAFAVQEVLEVPIEAHDVGLDFIATEFAVYRAERKPRGAAPKT